MAIIEEKSSIKLYHGQVYDEQGRVWFGNSVAYAYTCTLTAEQKDVWYALIKEKGLEQHTYQDKDTLEKMCQECWRIAARS